jgi:ATP-binding cassette, subfamily C, bacterial exporter for protease/lipase
VVLISHRPGIVSVADRLLILHEGTVQASGPRDGVLAALQKQREQCIGCGQCNAAQAVPPCSTCCQLNLIFLTH